MSEFVSIRNFESRHEAERAKSILDASEIEAVLDLDDCSGWWNALLPSPRGFPARLLVLARDVSIADEALKNQGL